MIVPVVNLLITYMLNGFNFSKLVLLSTLIFTYANASSSQLLYYQGLLL